jgi:hypothetical protein
MLFLLLLLLLLLPPLPPHKPDSHRTKYGGWVVSQLEPDSKVPIELNFTISACRLIHTKESHQRIVILLSPTTHQSVAYMGHNAPHPLGDGCARYPRPRSFTSCFFLDWMRGIFVRSHHIRTNWHSITEHPKLTKVRRLQKQNTFLPSTLNDHRWQGGSQVINVWMRNSKRDL